MLRLVPAAGGAGARAQRGSMLAGVLIFITFFALVGGAMLLRLSAESSQFRVAAARAQNQATLQSAAEAEIASLKSSGTSCPATGTTSSFNLNNQSATVICSAANPAIDNSALKPIGHCFAAGPCAAQSAAYGTPTNFPAFNFDGSYFSTAASYCTPPVCRGNYGGSASGARLPVHEYVAVDDQANVYGYLFDNSSATGGTSCPGQDGVAPGLTISSAFYCPYFMIANAGARPTAPPLLYLEVQPSPNNEFINALVPLSGLSGCATACVELIVDNRGVAPPRSSHCTLPSLNNVTAQPQIGANNPTTAFFGDAAGFVYAYSAASSGNCAAQITTPQSLMVGIPATSIAAGPFVFPGNGNSDDLVFVTANGYVEHFSFNGSAMTPVGTPLSLGRTGVVGATIVGSQCPLTPCSGLSANSATELVATFADGSVASANVFSNRSSTGGTTVHPNGATGSISHAPHWCPASTCGSDLVGVDYGSNGSTGELYVLNASTLATVSYYVAPSAGVGFNTTPLPISVPTSSYGHWLVGADNGYMYEVAQQAACPSACAMGMFTAYGVTQSGRPIRSSPQGTGNSTDCGGFPCLFVGSQDGYQYYLSLSIAFAARPSDIYVCLSSAPSCSSTYAQLWVRVLNSTYEVVVWSYQNL